MYPLLLCKSKKHFIFWVCVFSLRYPACKAHAPYCHLWPAWLYNIFPHYLINGTIFEGGKKRLLNTKCVLLIFPTNFVRNVSHPTKKWARYDQKCILVCTQSTRYSCPILIKLEFSRQILEKNPQISNFMKIRPVGTEFFHADRWTYMTKLIVAFRNFANAPKIGTGEIARNQINIWWHNSSFPSQEFCS